MSWFQCGFSTLKSILVPNSLLPLPMSSRYDTYDEVMKILPKLPRPVLITFARSAGERSMAAAAARQASIPPEVN